MPRLNKKLFISMALALCLTFSASAWPAWLAWDPNTDQIEGYKVYYGTSYNEMNQSINVGDATSLNLDQLPLTENVQYWFSVAAYNMDGESRKTSPLSYTPRDATPPPPPDNVFIWTGASNSDWEDPQNWDAGEVPGDGASVIIPADRPPAIHSITNGEAIIDQLSCSGPLTISGGSLSIDGDF